jgi:hypothetical protein
MAPWLFLQVSFSLIALACFLVYKQYLLQKNRGHLPPGPKALPLVGNFMDLPPKGTPEFQHWFKHKDTYGPISSVTVMGLTLVIFHDKEAARIIMGKKAMKTSGRPHLNFAALCGFDTFLISHQFNDTYRKHRKMVHQEIGTSAQAARFNPVQQKEALHFLLRTLDEPENMIKHLKTYLRS